MRKTFSKLADTIKVPIDSEAHLIIKRPSIAYLTAAQNLSIKQVDQARKGAEILSKFGMVPVDIETEQPHVALGVAHELMVRNLADLLVIGWEGFDIEFSKSNIQRIMNDRDVVDCFWNAVISRREQIVEEGNASGSSSNGTSVAEPNTVLAATN